MLENQILSKKQRKLLVKQNAECENKIKQMEEAVVVDKPNDKEMDLDQNQNQKDEQKPEASSLIEQEQPKVSDI